MLNIGLVQPNFQSGPKHLNAYYLPYSVGVLWSYAKQNPLIKNSVSNVEWVFKRDSLDAVVKQLKECDVVFFSIYVWNKSYCYELAKQLKEVNSKIAEGIVKTHKKEVKKEPITDKIKKVEDITSNQANVKKDEKKKVEEKPDPSWKHLGSAWYHLKGLDPLTLKDCMAETTLLRFRLAWRDRLSANIAFHADFAKPPAADEKDENKKNADST
jgi:hypothetical protein